jgi:hypothetical protein
MNNKKTSAPRRKFLGNIATSAAALGLLAIPSTIKANPLLHNEPANDADEWFKNISGKHKVVFDATHPNQLFPFAWPRVFLMTNEVTGTAEKDNSVVVVLRHLAIAYAFEDRIWEKYKFGEFFKTSDPATQLAYVKNPFWRPKSGTYKIPGVGNIAIGINDLQQSGVMFAVCDSAITVNSAVMADSMKMDAAAVKKDWMSGLLPDVHVVPSGVWALGRAQEHGCAYIFAG